MFDWVVEGLKLFGYALAIILTFVCFAVTTARICDLLNMILPLKVFMMWLSCILAGSLMYAFENR